MYYVTVTLMTFGKQSNGRGTNRIEVESYFNRRITALTDPK